MARHMGDAAETFRVVLEYERPKRNPEWHYRDNRNNSDVREFLDEWETYRTFRGPYTTAGAARGQFRRQRDESLWGPYREVRQYVERSSAVWEEI